METHFERANYHIVSVYEIGKAIDAGMADDFERGALTHLFDMMRRYSKSNETLLYEANEMTCQPVQVTDTFTELRRYFAKYPERLYSYDDRKFEELIRDILRDLGFDAHLTKKSRDGGRDILAHMRNQVTSFLMFVECKRYQPSDKVGIDVVQRLHGACDMNGAHKGMIVTTSFFTKPAIQEQMKKADKMELADYERLKEWLSCR